MHKITVVWLGPGARAHITLGALETLEKAKKLILRTGEVDAAKYLREKGLKFETLDDLHEECEDFEEFSAAAADADLLYFGNILALQFQFKCHFKFLLNFENL